MKNTTEHITTAHANDMQWTKDLQFYKEELVVLTERLGEVSSKNTSKDIKILVSHYENQFIINQNIIDEMKTEIHQREASISNDVKGNPVAYEHRLIQVHAELKGKMEVFVKLFAELRSSFNRFLSETM